jgi:hypothetical protein
MSNHYTICIHANFFKRITTTTFITFENVIKSKYLGTALMINYAGNNNKFCTSMKHSPAVRKEYHLEVSEKNAQDNKQT